jgi:hypothetical protein
MTAALGRLVKRIAADLGPDAAEALLRAARAWMSDPANAAERDRLVAALSEVSRRAGGLTAALAGSAAGVVAKYRTGAGPWERDLMSARYAIPQLPSGDARAVALETYLALTEAGPGVIAGARDRARARHEVTTALDLEARMLRTEALGPRERALALEINARARAACTDAGTDADARQA